jgi:CheY-like chemotaxis protein
MKMNVLIIDDEQVRHDTFEKFLTNAGHCVLHAFDGEEALEIFKSCPDPIGLAIFDHDMPGGMTGSALATQVLMLPKIKHPVRVIVVSQNHNGALNIISKFQGSGIHTIYLPFFGDQTAKRIVEELIEQ